jgi:FdhE protein
VAADFLRSLFRRTPAPPTDVADALGQLQELGEQRPTLAAPCKLLADLLPLLFSSKTSAVEFQLPAERAAAKLAEGIPLLRAEAIPIAEDLARRWDGVSGVIANHHDSDGGRRLQELVRKKALWPRELMRAVLSDDPAAVRTLAQQHNCDPDLTATVLRFTLLPSLSQLNVALAPLRPERGWEYGYCPTCGSWPLLGEFRGLEHTRYLRCGWCAAEWKTARLRCPFCGNREHEKLGYLHVEKEETKYRAAMCEACRAYMKMVSSLGALSLPALLVADVATLHLDLAAAERGYLPPS